MTILAKKVCFQVSQRDVETEKKLKKDLKRTKVLLADAQIMLDHLKSNAPSKREIAQLKNQVCHSYQTLWCVSADNGLKLCIYLTDTTKSTTFDKSIFLCLSRIDPRSWPANVSPLSPPLPSSYFTQLEESEFTCAAAVKARKSMEIEIEDLHIQMEDVVKAKISVSFECPDVE